MQTIVLVEDDPDIREVLTLVLADTFPDCTVHAAATGLAFLDLLQQQQPDLVLLDLQLPDVNGLFLYKVLRLRRDRKQVPVLFVTANPHVIRQTALTGRFACLAKPFDIDELVEQVQVLLDPAAATKVMSA